MIKNNKQLTKKLYKCAYGISSYTKNNKHVFMLDFDNFNLSAIAIGLKRLQLIHRISDFYIIESTHGYNAISLDKLTLDLIVSLVKYKSYLKKYVCSDFIEFGIKRKYFCLRFGKDKSLKMVLHNNPNKYEKSLAHAKFLEWFFNIDIYKDYNFDDNTRLDIIRFPSKKHGFHDVNHLSILNNNIEGFKNGISQAI